MEEDFDFDFDSNPVMEKPMVYDQKLFDYLEKLYEKFNCTICNGVVMSAKITQCGHIFCEYCLGSLESIKINPSCPNCNEPIKQSSLSPETNAEIEEILEYCSPQLLNNYQQAKIARAVKAKDKAKFMKNLMNNIPVEVDQSNSKFIKNIEEMFSTFEESVGKKSPPSYAQPTAASSKRSSSKPAKGLASISNPKSKVNPKPRSKTGLRESDRVQIQMLEVPSNTGIDTPSVNSLFNLYDSLLRCEPESGGSGDSSPICGDLVPMESVVPIQNDPFENESSEIKAMKRKIQQEIQVLIDEADGSVELYDFVQKWTKVIRDVAVGENEKQIEDEVTMQSKSRQLDLKLALHDNAHKDTSEEDAVNTRWKSSSELIQEFKDIKHSAGTLEQERLSTDPQWDSISFDAPVELVSKAIRTQFDVELKKLVQGQTDLMHGKSSRTRNCKENDHPVGLKSGNLHYLSESSLNRTTDYPSKIMRCKTALNDLNEKTMTAIVPAQLKNILPEQEYKEARVSTAKSTHIPQLSGSQMDVIFPEIEHSFFQNFSEIIQKRRDAYCPVDPTENMVSLRNNNLIPKRNTATLSKIIKGRSISEQFQAFPKSATSRIHSKSRHNPALLRKINNK